MIDWLWIRSSVDSASLTFFNDILGPPPSGIIEVMMGFHDTPRLFPDFNLSLI